MVDSYSITYHDHRYSDCERILLRGGATRLLAGQIILPATWHDVDETPKRRQGLLEQFRCEQPEGHILAGRRLDLLASCDTCDDVLFHLRDDDAYAVVHLTWRSSP